MDTYLLGNYINHILKLHVTNLATGSKWFFNMVSEPCWSSGHESKSHHSFYLIKKIKHKVTW